MNRNINKYLFETTDNDIVRIHKRYFPAGVTFPPHWHDFLELEIVVSGSLTHNYNNNVYTLQPGSAHVISYYDFHELTSLTDVMFYCVHFNRKFFEPSLSEFLSYNSILCQFNSTEMDSITQDMETIYKESQSSLPFRNLYAKNVLSRIIIQMIRKKTNSVIANTPQPIQQAIAFIADNFLQKLTLEDVAKELSFAPSYLGKLFKNQMGYSFNDYLNSLRLKHACGLLETTTTPVKDIAFQSGYGSVEYFLYSFKKRLQMTPSEYRELFSQASKDGMVSNKS